jgi:hypothetical protein
MRAVWRKMIDCRHIFKLIPLVFTGMEETFNVRGKHFVHFLSSLLFEGLF